MTEVTPTPAFDAFNAKFRLAELEVRRYKHWTWSVRPAQGTLGASVISLNRPATSWAEVDAGENAGLSQAVTDIEAVLRRQFSFDKINYLMLMMVDEQVHFHVFPRYSGERQFGGRTWLDANWPKPPDLAAGEFGPELLAELRETLRRG
jgi:diadenosine tetraphosphate (Ap4A) HIT family hydrolase